MVIATQIYLTVLLVDAYLDYVSACVFIHTLCELHMVSGDAHG